MAEFVSEALTIVWLLLLACITATYFLERFRLTLLPPSTLAMGLGILSGSVVKLAGLEEALTFRPSAFFYGLLPPIVFAAGFNLKKREFFRNIGTISLFAVAGTLVSTLVFGTATWLLAEVGIVRKAHLGASPLLTCMLYGALISATDPVATLAVFSQLDVPSLLYNLVFGESVLNDAVAVVLFSTLAESASAGLSWASLPLLAWRFVIIGAGSLAVGIAVALACAFVLKRFELAGPGAGSIGFNARVYEMTLVIMSSYLAYLWAEVVRLSGIVALFTTAICHAHYSYYSVARDSQIALRAFFETAAFLSEAFVFIYLGLQVARLGSSTLDWGLLVSGVPLCLLARGANILPLARLANLRRKLPLPLNLQAMMVACGLRGAIAFGLAMRLPQAGGSVGQGVPAIESATLVIVVVSTLLFGGATGPLLGALELRGASDADVAAMGLMARDPALSPAAALQAAEEARAAEGRSLYERFKSLDRRFLKPLFGGRQGSGGSHPLADEAEEGLLSDGEGNASGGEDDGRYGDGDGSSGGRYVAPREGGYEAAAAAEAGDSKFEFQDLRAPGGEVPLAPLEQQQQQRGRPPGG